MLTTEQTVAACRDSQARLLQAIEGLDDATARRPSLLPDWSVGHVLTHVARNADSFVRMLGAAQRGESVEQYAGGYGQRAADIEAGAGRPARELVDDVRASAAALEATWAGMTDEAWDGHGLNAGGRPWPCRQMPFHRWREVEIHHADLGLAYTYADWPEDYVAVELPRMLVSLPDRMPNGENRRLLLAWLVGRAGDLRGVSVDQWQGHYFAGGGDSDR